MIEKIIHYVWLGDNEIPAEFQDFINGWKQLHPKWQFIIWNEGNFDVESNSWVSAAVEQKNYSLAADVIRSYALLVHGGVYLDVDVQLLKPLDPFVEENDFFIGYETDLWFGCAILGAKKGHKIIKEVYDRYLVPYDMLNSKSNMLCVFNFSAVIKRLYGIKLNGKTQKIADNTILYSSEWFFPKSYMTHMTEITENTVAIHHYTSTWWSTGQRRGQRFARRVRLILGKKFFNCFERIARKRMFRKLKKEDKIREGLKEKC